jgi:hypothetical protein
MKPHPAVACCSSRRLCLWSRLATGLLLFLLQLISAEAGWFTTKEQDLLYYVRHDDYAQVEKLLAAGADANTASKNGETPLYWAAYNDKDVMVEKLLAAGADANTASIAISAISVYTYTQSINTLVLNL